MAKTKEELTQLKGECETLNTKLQELSEDELKMVTGGIEPSAFLGLFVPLFTANQQPKSAVNPEDQQIVCSYNDAEMAKE